jgi:hypothetical protein
VILQLRGANLETSRNKLPSIWAEPDMINQGLILPRHRLSVLEGHAGASIDKTGKTERRSHVSGNQ